MNVDNIITIDNNEKYLLIFNIELFGKDFYLGAKINDEENNIKYKLFERVNYKNNIFVKEETNQSIIRIIFNYIVNNYESI